MGCSQSARSGRMGDLLPMFIEGTDGLELLWNVDAEQFITEPSESFDGVARSDWQSQDQTRWAMLA